MTIAEMQQACELASEESAAICAGKRKWTMSIPVRDDDSDIIFAKVREAMPRLLAFVQAWDAWDKAKERMEDFVANPYAGDGHEKERLQGKIDDAYDEMDDARRAVEEG